TTLTVTREVAKMVTPDLEARVQPRLQEGQKILVAARGITPVLGFALDEAQLRKATLCVLYVKEVAVYFSGGPASLGRAKWQDDPEANAIMSLMMKLGAERDICVLPVYAVSQDAAATIVDLSATMGVDYLVIGATQRRTGKTHPGAAEIIAQGETDWRRIVNQLTGSIPESSRHKGPSHIFYQKQMTHHFLPEIDRGWIVDLTNCFLIRDPREVILSYIKKNPEPKLEDLGFAQQCEIFDFVRERTNSSPPVVDAHDVLQNPERILRLLCDAIGVAFDTAMLSWPPGLRETDG